MIVTTRCSGLRARSTTGGRADRGTRRRSSGSFVYTAQVSYANEVAAARRDGVLKLGYWANKVINRPLNLDIAANRDQPWELNVLKIPDHLIQVAINLANLGKPVQFVQNWVSGDGKIRPEVRK